MFTGYIYRHWLINDEEKEKSYIGLTTQALARRWRNGEGYRREGTKFYNAIKKYGWDSFNHEVLETVEANSKEELIQKLKELEKYYIDKYDSFVNGYNMTRGGDDVGLNRGESHHFYGKTHSEETRRKLSEARKKFYIDGGEHPRGMLGKTHSENYKQRLSEEMSGKNNHMYGKKHSEESKKKISESLKGKEYLQGENNPSAKKVICVETGEVFNTMKEACEWCGLKYSTTIVKACKDENKSAGKHPKTGERLHWKYAN